MLRNNIQLYGGFMLGGFYAIFFTGSTGYGMGMLALKNGIVTGADAAGGLYDGTYAEFSQGAKAKIRMTFPPGASLVTGALAGTQALSFEIEVDLPPELNSELPVPIKTPTGTVNVIFRKLRDFPEQFTK